MGRGSRTSIASAVRTGVCDATIDVSERSMHVSVHAHENMHMCEPRLGASLTFISPLCSIFFDEIDGLAPVRSSRQDQIHSSIVSTLLALMDGLDSR